MPDPHVLEEIQQHLAALHKRRGLIISVLAVALLFTTLHNETSVPLYEANAQLLIELRAPNILPHKELIEQPQGGSDYYQTHFELLRGQRIAERVVERLGLTRRPELLGGAGASLLDRWRRVFDADARKRRTEMSMPEASAAFREALRIDPISGTRIVNVRFRSPDPRMAAEAANGVAEAYIEQSFELRFASSSQATGWLDERLREQKKLTEEAERAVQRYREREGLVNLAERQGIIEQKLLALTAAAVAARTELVEKKSLYEQMLLLSPEELAAFPLVRSSSVVEQLRSQIVALQDEEAHLAETLGDRHPTLVSLRARIERVEEKISRETRELLGSVAAEHNTALQKEKHLRANVEEAKREALVFNKKALQCNALERAAEGHRKLLDDLMARAKETGLESELKTTNLRLVERARVPGATISPRRWRNYGLALLVGLFAAVLIVLTLEHIDNTIKTPEDVKVALGAPFLGMIPAVPVLRASETAAALVLLQEPLSAAAEAYRVLRTNLLFSSPEATERIFVVSSAGAGDGKTTITANLSAALAQNGARVLAIDSDLRRPTLHQRFGLKKAPGLSDLIVGNCPLAEALQNTKISGLQFIGCGYIPPNPAELLGSQSMKDLLVLLRKRFDWVLLDTPPLLGMADASVLAPFVDGMALVVTAERSTRPALLRGIDQISAVGGKLTGVILNKVDLERNSYYYGRYYGEYFRSEYTSSRNDSTVKTAAQAGRRASR
ncbi:MAG: polysaccharide biosynthesis tyrosine autokinase [Vicinamibacteria bacterium]|nr:polysaccharide biosynthesis tyrosine autokinase [Vicinamibacteria bacterium]